jgi:hypothetical protein
MIAAFDPLLRRSDKAEWSASPRRWASEPRAFWGGYGASKAAFENLLGAYADETAHAGKPARPDHRPRRDPHPHAPARLSRRGTVEPQDPRRGRRGDRRALLGDAETGSRFRID